MMDNSWSDTLFPLVRSPTALARRRANTTPMSQGLYVFLLSGSAVTVCLRDSCPNIPLRQTKQFAFPGRWGEPGHGALWLEGCAIHHCGTQEHRVDFPSVQCSIPDCVCLLFDPSSLCTHTPCRTHIFFALVPCVTYRHEHAWLKVFAVCMSYLSISTSPFSCFIRRLCCSRTVTSTPRSRLHRLRRASPDPKARVKRTSARAPGSLATWPIPRT